MNFTTLTALAVSLGVPPSITPPRSAPVLLSFVQANPGRVSFPRPPGFHGTTL